MNAKSLSQILRWAYCLDYGKFCLVFKKPEDDCWCKEKFPKMVSDFTKFYCELDEYHQNLFVKSFKETI